MKQLKEILNTTYGVCSFDLVKDRLISCRKKADIPENAKSILLFTFPYKVKEEKPENISRYSAVADYHPIVEQKLQQYASALKTAFPENFFVPFVDNSPIPEVYAAACANLGVIGQNGLLITKEYGSFVFIGEIVTDMYIETENSYKECLRCGLCEKACPVGLDKTKCLSKVTQQKKDLTEEQKLLIQKSGCIWGCDICAEVCPLNQNKKLTIIKEFRETYRDSYVLGEDSQNRPYIWRGEEIIKRNHNILCKNKS